MPVPLSLAVEEFLLARAAEGLSERSVETYAYVLRPLVTRLRSKAVERVTSNDIRKYLVEMRQRASRYHNAPQRPEQPGPLSLETIRSRIRQLRVFFDWCQVEYDLPDTRNPMAKIKSPRSPRREPKAVDPGDVQKLYDATEGNSQAAIRDRALLLFLLDTGARAGGICALITDNLNLEEGKAVLTEKDGRARRVPFTRLTARALHRWLAVRPLAAKTVFCSLGPATSHPLHGAILTTNGLHQIFKRLAKKAGVTGRFNPHAFRHGFAREALRNGGNLPYVSRVLGQNPQTTLLFYGIFDDRESQEMHEQFSPVHLLKGGNKELGP